MVGASSGTGLPHLTRRFANDNDYANVSRRCPVVSIDVAAAVAWGYVDGVVGLEFGGRQPRGDRGVGALKQEGPSHPPTRCGARSWAHGRSRFV